MHVHVKICGVTSIGDAEQAIEAGADAIGLNFVPASPRFVSVGTARAITAAVRGRVVVVGVVADSPAAEMRSLRDAVGLDRLQLHGDEPPEVVLALAPFAYKALRIRDAGDVERAARFGGEPLLVDAFVAGQLGGTGTTVAPGLAAAIARTRSVLLAGGLTPDNVADAIRAIRPWGVDVATGVESRPGVKDPDKLAAFVTRARSVASP